MQNEILKPWINVAFHEVDENNVDNVYFRLYYILISYKCSMRDSDWFYNQSTEVKKKNNWETILTAYFWISILMLVFIFLYLFKVYMVFLLLLYQEFVLKTT